MRDVELEATTAAVYTAPNPHDRRASRGGYEAVLPLLILSPYQQAERIADSRSCSVR